MDECKPLVRGSSRFMPLHIEKEVDKVESAGEVRRCRLTLSNPRFKRLEFSS